MARRLLAVGVTGLVLYGLAPALAEVFGAWDHLGAISWPWWIGVIATQLAALTALIAVQRVALATRAWFAVSTSNLASTAISHVVPGGSAASAALQYAMLRQAGLAGPAVAIGLTAGGVVILAAVAGLPVLSLPAILAGNVPRRLEGVALVALLLFAGLFAISATLLTWTRAVRAIGRGAAWLIGKLPGREAPADLPERLVVQCDLVRDTFGRRRWEAIGTAVAHWLLDFLCLLCALLAVGARPQVALVLLAYVAAQLLSQIPATPGGLGVVEAGLTGALALAGIDAAGAALATLAYRLASFWLPLPLGLAAWIAHRRRYGDSSTLGEEGSPQPA